MNNHFKTVTAAALTAWLMTFSHHLGATQKPNSLTIPGAVPVKLAEGFSFTEGPAVDANGDIFFTDVPMNRIYKWSVADQALSLFRANTGAANGLFFDADGNLIACEGNARRITATTPTGEVTTVISRFKGRRFNRPNDLWIDPKGGIYFTDPAYGRGGSDREINVDGVYYISPQRDDIIRVSSDLNRPNGIIGSADGKRLFITELSGDKTWTYQIESDGHLSEKKLLIPAGSDGMTLDAKHNIYLTNQKSSAVDIYSSQGDHLQSISVPETPANVTFGGPERQTLFITAVTSLYSIDMQIRGDR